MGQVKKTHLDDAPRVVVFAGPNGAGKSTHADDILKAMGIPTFVNADYIARGLAGSRRRKPIFSSDARWLCTVDGEVRPTASPISRTLGGYPRSRMLVSITSRMPRWRGVRVDGPA